MKNKLITQIQVSMASMLDASQLAELRQVLTNTLRGVEITQKQTSPSEEAKENVGLLDVFIAVLIIMIFLKWFPSFFVKSKRNFYT